MHKLFGFEPVTFLFVLVEKKIPKTEWDLTILSHLSKNIDTQFGNFLFQ